MAIRDALTNITIASKVTSGFNFTSKNNNSDFNFTSNGYKRCSN